MEFGAHLPQIASGDVVPSAHELAQYAVLAEQLGYTFLSANDHIVFRSGRLDGLTCLAAVCSATERVRLATMFSYITDDPPEAERVARTVLQPALGHPAEELVGRLLLGRAEECADKVGEFKSAGVQRLFIWPVADAQRQLRLFMEKVAPRVQ